MPENPSSKSTSLHKWRLCPYGEHWVKEHTLTVPPSSKHPSGYLTVRRAHCAKNRTGKDQLYADEILEMSKVHFSRINPTLCDLDEFKNEGKAYDDLIVGWTQYWNDVLQPEEPLDPSLVKALIASESGFKPTVLVNKRNSNSARGLMQLTNSTRRILGDEKGELKDHFVTATKIDLNDPSINICCGVRWLFHKKQMASKKLKRNATWEDAVFEYKGLSIAKSAHAKSEIVEKFRQLYERLNACKR